MENILKKLEEAGENYMTSLTEKPISTVIKTFAVIWLIAQIKRMLK